MKQIPILLNKHVDANFTRIPFRTHTANVDSVTSQHTAAERFKSFIPFEQILESRRQEASRSIIVQVRDRKSCASLLTHCLNFGNIRNTFYYTFNANPNFLLIEYDDIVYTEAALKSAACSTNADVVPVKSPLMWFRLDLKGSQVHKDLPYVHFDYSDLPTTEELVNLFSESNSFNDDMMLLYNRTKLTETGSRLRYITALQIENAFKSMFLSCRVLPFGSSANSFGKMNCDLDLVMELNSLKSSTNHSKLIYHVKNIKGMDSGQNQQFLETVADVLQYILPGCINVRRILRARVPILKYKQELTGVDCDLSCTNLSGVYMTELLHIYASYDWRVCPLIFTVRYWAQEVGLTNPAPGKWITNFSLTLLVLFFLQYEKIIPTLDFLMKHKRPEDSKFIEDNDCGFLTDLKLIDNLSTIDNKDSLVMLLYKFFEFYSTLDFTSYAVSLNASTLIPKPVHAPLYIINPLEKGLNVSRNVSPEECERLKMTCRHAAWSIDCCLISGKAEKKWGLLDLIKSHKIGSPFYELPGMRSTSRISTPRISMKKIFEIDGPDEK